MSLLRIAVLLINNVHHGRTQWIKHEVIDVEAAEEATFDVPGCENSESDATDDR